MVNLSNGRLMRLVTSLEGDGDACSLICPVMYDLPEDDSGRGDVWKLDNSGE